tara:strand:- start:10843 stop:10947 length:105 start_codon:yes stop_codon:yes gene_type:complete
MIRFPRLMKKAFFGKYAYKNDISFDKMTFQGICF